MNKTQVLKWPPCEKPEAGSYRLNRRRDGGIILAKAQIIVADRKPVLNIDLFRKDPVKECKGILSARYFAEKETGQYKVLFRNSQGKLEWRKIILDNAALMITRGYVTPGGNYWYRVKDWEFDTEEDEKTTWKYLGETVGCWENNVNSNKYYTAQKRKQDRITAMMVKTIPDIPGDFNQWIRDKVFPREYVFIKKPEKENGYYKCFCTACGKHWRTKRSLGIGYINCRHCGKKVLISRKEKETSREEQVYLLQPCKTDDGTWVERAFKVRAEWKTGELEKLIGIDEQIRVITPKNGCWGTCYYEYGLQGKNVRLYWDKNSNNLRMKAGYLYDRNRGELEKCWCDALKHSGMWTLAEKQRVNVNNMIIHAKGRPYMEYLIKGRFERLAGEIAKGSYEEGSYINKGSTPGEVFGISNDKVDRLRRMDGGITVLSWLKEEERTGKKVNQENLEWADQHGLKATELNILTMTERMGSPNVVINYIRKQCSIRQKTAWDVIETWRDYMRMAELQGLNITHELFYKPKDIYAAHDACVREGQRKKTMMRANEIRKKFPQTENVLKKIQQKYTYAGEQYCVKVPDCIEDIIHEGRALGHCIDTTDRYFDRIEQETSYIVFLRKAEAPEVPWYTLEIEPGGTVRQQRTTGNEQKKEDAKKYTPFLREWQKVIRERISEEDRRLAEKSRKTRITEYAELREKQEKVWRGKLAGKLLADVLEADLIECIV